MVVITVNDNCWKWWGFLQKVVICKGWVWVATDLLSDEKFSQVTISVSRICKNWNLKDVWNVQFHTSGFEANFHSTRICFLVGEDVSKNPYGIIFIFRVKFLLKSKKNPLQNQLWNSLSFIWLFVCAFPYRHHHINYWSSHHLTQQEEQIQVKHS